MAAKNKTVYQCTSCGDTFIAWMGQCPSCKTWNSFEEKKAPSKASGGISASGVLSDSAEPVKLNSVEKGKTKRISTGLKEMDKILGGGLVLGSVVLLGGEPGVGKSTLLLAMGRSGKNLLYVSGEESIEQVYERAQRTGSVCDNITLLQETRLEAVLERVEKLNPDILLVDSIQTMTVDDDKGTGPGSPTQLRSSTSALVDFARKKNIPVIMTGHITKDGQIAGPKLLEHSVDAVLYFENQKFGQYRFIRSTKNRYGSTGEIAVFEMTSKGLEEIQGERSLLHMDDIGGVGSILFPQIDGTQAMLVEVQVLVTPAAFSSGRRIGENIDVSRIHMIAAILEKYCSYNIGQSDIFVRVQGGVAMRDTAGDLALLIAMASSFMNIELPSRWAAAGELSLTGKIRNPVQMDARRKSLLAHNIPNVLWGGSQVNEKNAPAQKAEKEYFFNDVKTCIDRVFSQKK